MSYPYTLSAAAYHGISLFALIFQLDINTVAAGGGSQLFFRAGMYVVGPESAGAHPGPVCYKKGITGVTVNHLLDFTAIKFGLSTSLSMLTIFCVMKFHV